MAKKSKSRNSPNGKRTRTRPTRGGIRNRSGRAARGQTSESEPEIKLSPELKKEVLEDLESVQKALMGNPDLECKVKMVVRTLMVADFRKAYES